MSDLDTLPPEVRSDILSMLRTRSAAVSKEWRDEVYYQRRTFTLKKAERFAKYLVKTFLTLDPKYARTEVMVEDATAILVRALELAMRSGPSPAGNAAMSGADSDYYVDLTVEALWNASTDLGLNDITSVIQGAPRGVIDEDDRTILNESVEWLADMWFDWKYPGARSPALSARINPWGKYAGGAPA